MKHHFIANTWINGLLTQLSALKIDLHHLVSELPDLEIDNIQQGQRIDASQLRQIWYRAEELSQDPLLGYTIGTNLNLKGLGVLTPILMHSPTGRQSLENIVQYAGLISNTVAFSLDDSREGYLIFNCFPVRGPIKESSQHIVSLLTSLLAMSRIMGVRKNAIHKLTLPGDLDLVLLSKTIHRKLEVATHAPYTIWFNTDALDDPIPGADNHLYQINKAYAEDLILQKKAGNDLIESIKALVIENGFQRANVDKVTDQLGISKRSLQRQLSEERTSFRNLKEEVIKERALLLTIRNASSIEKISQELGYSEVSAFHRAFKIWFGVTPKNYSSNPAIQF